MKNPKGIEITKAQGHEITKNINPLESASLNSNPNIKGDKAVIKTAIKITIGVYTFENLVINFSVLDLFLPAFSINSTIFETVEF